MKGVIPASEIARFNEVRCFVQGNLERILGEFGQKGITRSIEGVGKTPSFREYEFADVDPPAGPIYYFGNPAILQVRYAANFSGTTDISCDGFRAVEALGQCLAKKGWILVTGHVFGSELASEVGVLDEGGGIIAVLGDGIFIDRELSLPNILLPRRLGLERLILEYDGCFICEFQELPSDFRERKQRHLARDRILSGLSDIVVVTESAKNSATVDTARQAYLQGKKVYALDWENIELGMELGDKYWVYIPSEETPLKTGGNKQVIREGIATAFPQRKTTSVPDLQQEFIKLLEQIEGITPIPPPKPELTEKQKAYWRGYDDYLNCHVRKRGGGAWSPPHNYQGEYSAGWEQAKREQSENHRC